MEKDIDQVLYQARQLYALGFAIHWLRPKSKIPLESGWTTGPRKDWKYLERTYQKGFNIGVRLGTPSKIGGAFLCVLDLDVKSTDERHLEEALRAAKAIIGERICPVVRSGRGNGSRHYYGLSSQPFKTFNPAASTETIKVHQPSKKPSRRECETLTKEEIEKGIRLSHAWEISLYSDGRQVVLPPSIHPDTGDTYRWSRPVKGIESIPLIEIETEWSDKFDRLDAKYFQKEQKSEKIFLPEFKVEPVELDWLPISDEVREAIKVGTGVKDRSGYLLKASSALFSAGLNQNEVLTVLTDNTTFLGACAYEHAKTKNRERAALWAYRFTTKKVETEMSGKGVFSGSLPEIKKLSPAEIEKQTAGMEENVYRAEEHGFYLPGERGKLVPAYNDLLKKFQDVHDYKSIADMKAVYVFNATHYEDITPIEIKAFAENYFSPKPSARTRTEFLEKILANNVARRRFFMDTTEGKINFKNGILDLNSGTEELTPHSSKIGFRNVLPYEFNPKARCPAFELWIKNVMLEEQPLIDILQEYMGYIIRGGEYRYHKALWLEGTGRNGKSTFIDILKALIGPSNFSTLSIKSLVNDKFAGSDLDGKIANFSEETSPQELADSGPFKNLTGDGDMSAQKKFGDIYSFRNRAKLVMSYNTIPDLKDLSVGMISRPLIVPFRKKIKEAEQDHDTKKKLAVELSGIFNFALNGWKRLESQNHFTPSESSKNALEKVRTESCNVYQWIENYVKFTDTNERKYRAGEVYSAYKGREKYAYGISAFGRKLNSHPEVKKRHTYTREGATYFGMEFL